MYQKDVSHVAKHIYLVILLGAQFFDMVRRVISSALSAHLLNGLFLEIRSKFGEQKKGAK